MTNRLPLPIADLFPKLGLTVESLPAPAILGNVRPDGVVLEEFVPVTESLEWRLAQHHWATRGLLPFIDGEVPFWINNTGRLSEDAAVLLFTLCESEKFEGLIHAVEFGAGTGLFARYLLDDLQAICKQEGRDYYERLRYLVTDVSATTVSQWAERKLFDDHKDRVQTLVAAADAVPIDRAHAIFANYVLDVLPAAVLHRTADSQWEELRVRTRWQGDAASLAAATGHDADHARVLARDPIQLHAFAPLLERLDFEVQLFPFSPDPAQQALLSFAGPGRQPVNFGAAAVIERCLAGLHPNGFLLVNDYGVTQPDEAAGLAFSQRFGPTSAIGLNFPLLAAFAASKGHQALAAAEDEKLPIHARLFGSQLPAPLLVAFQNRFSHEARTRIEVLMGQARQHAAAGRRDDALRTYTTALEAAPRDWTILGEAADFVGLQLNDAAAGLELARGAVQRNPWYSSWLWNILGDCLYGLRRFDEAHESYLQAERIDPKDPRTNLNLSFTLLQSSRFEEALAVLARGLGGDATGAWRDRLLAKQTEVLQAITARARYELERQQRRAARLCT